MIDFTNLQKSVQHLDLQYANYLHSANRQELTVIDREAISESVIQRFETCYDTIWKVMKRFLVEELGLSEVPNSPKPIIKLMGQNNLLPSAVEVWLVYADARTSTAHDYSGVKAQSTLLQVANFLVDAKTVYTTMSGQPWL